jgi:hypothetical protein
MSVTIHAVERPASIEVALNSVDSSRDSANRGFTLRWSMRTVTAFVADLDALGVWFERERARATFAWDRGLGTVDLAGVFSDRDDGIFGGRPTGRDVGLFLGAVDGDKSAFLGRP